MRHSTARMLGIVFIVVSLLSFCAGIIIDPAFVERHLSGDHALKTGTIERIQDARKTAVTLGVLAAIAALPLLARPRLTRSEKQLAIYIAVVAAALYLLTLGNPTQADYTLTSYAARLSIDHWNIYDYVVRTEGLPDWYAGYPPGYFVIQGVWFSIMGAVGLIDLASWAGPMHTFNLAFFGKIPILFAIVLAALFLWKLLPPSKRALGLGIFLFSPALIDSVLLQGQFDVIVACFVLAGLLVARGASAHDSFDLRRSLAAILLVGLSGCFKPYGLLLVPIFAVSLAGRSRPRALVLTAAGILPCALSFLPYAAGSPLGFGAIVKAFSAQPSGRLLEMTIANHANSIPVFLCGYFLLIFFIFETERRDEFTTLLLSCWAAMSWFFVTIYFHPQWFVWLCAVAVLGVTREGRLLKWYVFQMILFAVYILKWCNIVGEALDQYTLGLIPCLPALSAYGVVNGVLTALFAAVTLYIPIAAYRWQRAAAVK